MKVCFEEEIKEQSMVGQVSETAKFARNDKISEDIDNLSKIPYISQSRKIAKKQEEALE